MAFCQIFLFLLKRDRAKMRNCADWNIVGFFAEISRILAEAGIPIGAISAFSRDHVLVKQEDLAKALKVLGKYIEEVC